VAFAPVWSDALLFLVGLFGPFHSFTVEFLLLSKELFLVSPLGKVSEGLVARSFRSR